jgi:hypothetical protein
MKYANVSAGVLLSVLFNAGAVEKAMDDSGAGLERTETVVVGRTEEFDAIDFPFLAADNVFTVGKGGAVVSRGSMTFGHALASAYNWYATNVFSIVDGGRIEFDNGGTSSSSAGFIFGSADVPRRRSRVLISGEGTVADFRHAYRSYFNGNTSVEITDGATVYMGRYCGLGNATNIASSAAATASETKMTVVGENTKIYLSLLGTADGNTGTARRNQHLSEARAKYVYDILTTKYNISKERLIIKSEVVKKAAKPALNRAVVISF